MPDIKTIGVIGGGVMGSGIAQALAVGGCQVTVRDLNEQLIEKSRSTIVDGRYGLKRGVERGRRRKRTRTQRSSRLSFTTSLDDLKSADLIIEAVPEDLELKKKVFARAGRRRRAGHDLRVEHFRPRDLGHQPGRVAGAAAAVHRHALVQPGAGDEARRAGHAPETAEETIQAMESLCQRDGQGDRPREGRAGPLRLHREPDLLRGGAGGAERCSRRGSRRRRTSTRRWCSGSTGRSGRWRWWRARRRAGSDELIGCQLSVVSDQLAVDGARMKIWSLLPSATEMLFALGLGDEITGVTHECDYPPEANAKPRVTFSHVDSSRTSGEIDRQVTERFRAGQQLYGIDEERLRAESAGPHRHAGPLPGLRRVPLGLRGAHGGGGLPRGSGDPEPKPLGGHPRRRAACRRSDWPGRRSRCSWRSFQAG